MGSVLHMSYLVGGCYTRLTLGVVCYTRLTLGVVAWKRSGAAHVASSHRRLRGQKVLPEQDTEYTPASPAHDA